MAKQQNDSLYETMARAWHHPKLIQISRFLFSLKKRSIVFCYLLPVVLMAGALLVRLAIAPVSAGLQYITFFPAVTLAAIAGGYRAGFFATLLGLIFATVIFTPPYYSLSWAVLQTSFWSNLVFMIDGIIVSVSIEAMHRYRQQYEHELKVAKKSEAHEQALNKNLSKIIDELKLAEQAMQESELRLLALFNTSAIAIVVIDEQGLIEKFNPGSEEIFGYSRAEVINQSINRLMPEPFASQHDGYLNNYLTTGLNRIPRMGRELIGKRKNGTTFPIEVLLGQAVLDDRRLFIGFIKDISERKKLEAASRQFQAIVQSSDDAIISKTLEGIVTSWNDSAESMFGYSAAEMIGNSMSKLFPPESRSEEKYILEQISSGQRVRHFETVRVRKDGSLIDVSVSLSPIVDETGKIIGASKIARDVTHNKQLERELVAAKHLAEAASRSKSEFLANMSHEIRTPMNAIIGLSRLVLETELTAKQQDYLRKIQTSSQALLGILNDILDLSKIESGRLEIEKIEFDPTLMLQSVSDLFVAKLEEKGLEIFLEVAPEVPMTVMGDPLRIQQVLSNLVSNAIKFTPKGEVLVRMELESSCDSQIMLRLSVRDTGIGISENVIEHLFQSFSQADSSITRKFGGSGLGLAISKQLVSLMGGSISVSSQLGQGSTFSFTVRCNKGQLYNWNQDTHSLKDIKVLVVDDQETSCVILRGILESWHLRVETALSAEQGLEKIYAAERDNAPFNLLLLDWKLEGMSGLALAHQLGLQESHGKLQHQPTIIMVTAYSKEQLLAEMSQVSTHLDTILTKPVLPSTLLNTILHVCRYQGGSIYQIPKTQISPYELARPLRNTHLLLVEDNDLNQQVASEFLEKAGLRVSIANHGGEAVQWLQKRSFDVVLMDLQMPEMDGYEATRLIRELPNCADLPIIAMTAAAMQNDRDSCLEAGMNDHVAKPIQPLELINTLLRWVKPVSSEQDVPSLGNQEVWSSLAQQLPDFDLQDIMIMLANDQEKLITMLIEFREQFIVEAPLIEAKIRAGELQIAERHLHTLKGAAGNLGAKVLHQACIALDTELVNGKYEQATLAHWLEALDKTMTAIAALQSQKAAEIPGAAPNLTLQQLMAELDNLLADDGFISDDLLMQLKKLLPEQQLPEYKILTQLIMDTNYAKARTILNKLRGLPNE